MPFKSNQQRKLFYAAAEKPGGVKGLDQNTAQKFINDSKGERFGKLKKKLKEKKNG